MEPIITAIMPSVFREVRVQPYELFLGSSFVQQKVYMFEEQAARHDIETIATLRDDWDGDGALAILDQTKRNALAAADWILASAPTPGIAPNPNGTISMEWESEFGSGHLEIGQSKYSFYIDRPGYQFFSSKGSIEQIEPYLGILISSYLFPLPSGAASTTLQGYVQRTR